MSAAFFSDLFDLLHFKQHRTQLLLIWPIELSSLSIDARSSSIFCILEVDFAISVITLFVVFNEALQKALVDKSVCVINIAHLIVLPTIKNPLFDVYCNRITALLTGLLFPAVKAYLRPCALFALRFPLVMRAYLTSFALPALIFVFSVFA